MTTPPPVPIESQSESGEHPVTVPTTLEALAEVTLAPVTELRHSPKLLRAAMACQLGSTLAALVVALQLGLPDWEIYGVMGIATNILAGNFMRWRRRSGWIRRSIHTGAALVVTLAWTVLLADRALTLSANAEAGSSPWFGLAAGALAVSAGLLLAHMGTSLRDDARMRAA